MGWGDDDEMAGNKKKDRPSHRAVHFIFQSLAHQLALCFCDCDECTVGDSFEAFKDPKSDSQKSFLIALWFEQINIWGKLGFQVYDGRQFDTLRRTFQ